ncbi:MAG: sugar phosphate isomerase/epimerase family protein [Planctomycetota bacterium]
MRFAICNELFEGWSFADVCEHVAAVGYAGLELAPFTLAPSAHELTNAQCRTLRATAAAAGLEIVGLHWLLAKTEGLHLTSPEVGVRDRTAAYLRDLARACHELGGSVMIFGSPGQRSLLPGVSVDQAFDHAVEVFSAITPDLDRLGVRLCLEPLGPVETDFINTCAEAARVVDAVAHPNVQLHLDVKAMCSEAEPVVDLVRRWAPRAGHFHANDPNLQGPGFGDLDFAPILSALRESGYAHWVSVEVFDFAPGAEVTARESLACLQRASVP